MSQAEQACRMSSLQGMQSTDCQGAGSLLGSIVATCRVACLHNVGMAVLAGTSTPKAVLMAQSDRQLHQSALGYCCHPCRPATALSAAL